MRAPSRQPLRGLYRISQGILVLVAAFYFFVVVLVAWSSLTPWGLESMDVFRERDTPASTTSFATSIVSEVTATSSPAITTTTTVELSTTTRYVRRVVTTTTRPVTTSLQDLVSQFNLQPPTRRWQQNQYGCHSDGRCLDEYDNWCDELELVTLEETGEDVCPETADDW